MRRFRGSAAVAAAKKEREAALSSELGDEIALFEDLAGKCQLPWIDQHWYHQHLFAVAGVSELPLVRAINDALQEQIQLAEKAFVLCDEREAMLADVITLVQPCLQGRSQHCSEERHMVLCAKMEELDHFTDAIIALIERWRSNLTFPLPFIYKGENYFQRMLGQYAPGSGFAALASHIKSACRIKPYMYQSPYDLSLPASLMTHDRAVLTSELQRQLKVCDELLTLAKSGLYAPVLRFRVGGKPHIPIDNRKWKERLVICYAGAKHDLVVALGANTATQIASQFVQSSQRAQLTRYFRKWLEWVTRRREMVKTAADYRYFLDLRHLRIRFLDWVRMRSLHRARVMGLSRILHASQRALRGKCMRRWFLVHKGITLFEAMRKVVCLRYFRLWHYRALARLGVLGAVGVAAITMGAYGEGDDHEAGDGYDRAPSPMDAHGALSVHSEESQGGIVASPHAAVGTTAAPTTNPSAAECLAKLRVDVPYLARVAAIGLEQRQAAERAAEEAAARQRDEALAQQQRQRQLEEKASMDAAIAAAKAADDALTKDGADGAEAADYDDGGFVDDFVADDGDHADDVMGDGKRESEGVGIPRPLHAEEAAAAASATINAVNDVEEDGSPTEAPPSEGADGGVVDGEHDKSANGDSPGGEGDALGNAGVDPLAGSHVGSRRASAEDASQPAVPITSDDKEAPTSGSLRVSRRASQAPPVAVDSSIKQPTSIAPVGDAPSLPEDVGPEGIADEEIAATVDTTASGGGVGQAGAVSFQRVVDDGEEGKDLREAGHHGVADDECASSEDSPEDGVVAAAPPNAQGTVPALDDGASADDNSTMGAPAAPLRVSSTSTLGAATNVRAATEAIADAL